MTGLLRQFLAAILSVVIAFPLGAASSWCDPVGNRLQKTSTLAGLQGGLSNYNANDQLATDTCDPNGNTAASNSNGHGSFQNGTQSAKDYFR
jgi:hypothetical protein